METAQFITETSLDLLARRLRFVGYDVLTIGGARLEELFEVGQTEGRIVLTLSQRHPRRFRDVTCLSMPRNDPAAAVRLIATSYEPTSLPFSRCPHCNSALQKRSPFEAHGEVPGRVLRSARTLQYCPSCARWFWFGSHVVRMSEWLTQVLGSEIRWPHDPPTGELTTPS